MTRRTASLMVIPIAAIVSVVFLGIVHRDEQPSLPVDVTAQAPRFTDLNELMEASDTVVIARVTKVEEGRLIGAADDPGAAVETQFATLVVGETLKGQPTNELILEEEASLPDGTPISVNGVMPSKVDDEGIFFATFDRSEGGTGRVALLNHQSRYLVTGSKRDLLLPASADPLGLRLASLGPFELRCQLLASDTTRRCASQAQDGSQR